MPRYPRKRHPAQPVAVAEADRRVNWLDVPAIARIQASSEDPEHSVVRAFSARDSSGWRAADAGLQVISVHFSEPRDLTHIRLVFDDDRDERTQQFTISWSAGRGERHGEVVRQQFNFSPRGAIREVENYVVALHRIETLQIRITPDISGGTARASLTYCGLA
jgi:hypothetical protein